MCIVTSGSLSKKLGWAIQELTQGEVSLLLIPDGEKAKEWKEVEKLLRKFSEINLDRKSLVIALGGGTVGDMVGFATSIYLRGIPYIQIPTTLLAQVDSAHGGKTGINFLGYKNQVGSFATPRAIVVDPRFLTSLSRDQIIDGIGEIIKAGIIKDPSILSLLSKHTLESLVNSGDLEKIIRKSIAVKNFFIQKDFKDQNIRQILNVGHTIGHALELKYKISHGRAVINGLVRELTLTESLGLTLPLVRTRLEALLTKLTIEVDHTMNIDWKTIIRDKKVSGNKIDLPIIEREGRARIIQLDLGLLKKTLADM